MIIIPMILNSIYFWIIDNILKLNPEDADKELTEIYIKETTTPPVTKPSSVIEMPTLEDKIKSGFEDNENQTDSGEILIDGQPSKIEETHDTYPTPIDQ